MFDNVGNVRFMQRINREKVLSYIRKNSPVSRNELSKVTGLSLSSITNIVNFFMDTNLVTETGRIKNEGAGRKAVMIEFNASAMSLIAINIETDEAVVSLTDLSGGIIESESVAISRRDSADNVLSAIERRVIEVISKHNNVKAIGFAVSGHVSADGRVSSSTMRWDRVDVKSRFEQRIGLPVYVSNNTKTKGLWTIRALNDVKHNNIVFLDMSSEGIGIINACGGEINNAVAGEFGHTVVTGSDHKCFCGNVGCLESVCSVSYIEGLYKELSGEGAAISEIQKRAESGNKLAQQVMDEACGYMSAAIINIIMIFEPDLIIVNASELFDIDALYNSALDRAVAHSSKLAMKKPDFRKVNIASDQSAQGAAQIAADELLGIDAPDDIL
ncbi:MAG: ROK family transcriptional regulator [Oscillospiraceae bacterium]|nr:ROK family transcriptional regulator [Oscillospiraceae bacterium]